MYGDGRQQEAEGYFTRGQVNIHTHAKLYKLARRARWSFQLIDRKSPIGKNYGLVRGRRPTAGNTNRLPCSPVSRHRPPTTDLMQPRWYCLEVQFFFPPEN